MKILVPSGKGMLLKPVIVSGLLGNNVVSRVCVCVTSKLSDSEAPALTSTCMPSCTLAHPLFSIYFSAGWQCGGIAVQKQVWMDVLFHHGRKMVGDRTAKLRLSMVKVTESQFTDDVALYTGSRGGLKSVVKKFVEGVREWGLTVSIEKTKGMALG